MIGGPRTITKGISVKNVKKNVVNATGIVKGIAAGAKSWVYTGTMMPIIAAPNNMPTTEPTSKLRHLEFLQKTTGTKKMM